MLSITIKNMLKSKFLTLCLFIGFILSTVIVSTVPMYADGVLNHFLKGIFSGLESSDEKDLKFEKFMFPASFTASRTMRFDTPYRTFLTSYDSLKRDFHIMSDKIPVPILARKITLAYDNISYNYTKGDGTYYSAKNQISSISDFEKHVTVLRGRLPEDNLSKDNCLDVMVDETTCDNFALELNNTYVIRNVSKELPLKIKIVGIFQITSKAEDYWRDKDTNFYCRFMTSESGFLSMYEKNEDFVGFFKKMEAIALYDYSKITSSNSKRVYDAARLVTNTTGNRLQTDTYCTITQNLEQYLAKERIYSTVLWMFLIPVLVVILYYIFMVSGFIIDSDRDQIAVMKSRGAGIRHIIVIYLYEGLILCTTAVASGPLLGALLCKLVGRADGFMSFKASEGINVEIGAQAYIFSIFSAIIMLATLLISAYHASKRSIVEVKRSKNKIVSKILTNRNMDFILLGLSAYGYYIYGSGSTPVLALTGTDKSPVDPLLYLVSTTFIVGMGLFLLRIYRYLMGLLYLLVDRLNLPVQYLSFTNILRYHLNRISVMLFVVFTVALGIFNIHVAKNINISYLNTVKYTSGADIITKGVWYKKEDRTYKSDPDSPQLFIYTEPSFSAYSKLQGIDKYTKVLRTQGGDVTHIGNMAISTNIMGIIPHEFGEIAWFDSSLLRTHWYHYLNALTTKQDLVLISKALSTAASLNKGDSIYYRIGPGLEIRGKVHEIIEFWPGYENLNNQNLVVSNLKYMFSKVQVHPYEVWMKKKSGVQNSAIYDSIRAEKIALTEFHDVALEEYKAKNDIFLKGTNAALTLGFMCIACICTAGFIIYWVLSLKKRALHFGVYRSLGISSGRVTGILMNEQIFTLGTSLLIGTVVGKLSADIFIPLIQNIWYTDKYVIPVRNISYMYEYLQLSGVLGLLLLFTLLVLIKYLSSLKINQAVKMGED